MGKQNQLKAGAFLSYLSMALSIIIGIIYTPIMLRLLGQSEYGLYNMVASTISMLSVLSLGLNSGYIRYFSKYKKNNDNESIYRLNGLYLIIFSIIGIIALVCGLFLSQNLQIIFEDGLTESEYEITKVLMILLTINLAISFPSSVFSHIISANERFIFLKVLGLIKTVIGPIVTLPVLLSGFGSIGMVAATIAFSLIIDVIFFIYAKFVLKQKFVFKKLEKGLFKDLFVYTSFIALNLIVGQVNNNVDKFLLGRYCGTISVSIYSVGYALYNYYTNFSLAISGVFTPRIHKIVNETAENQFLQRKKLTNLFIKVGRIQFIVLALIASGFIFFGQHFIYFWAGDDYSQSYYVALLLIVPSTIPLTQNLGIAIQRAENKHKFRSIVYAIMLLINIALSIYLCQIFDAVGACIGTAISLILANGFIMNVYYHKKCNIDILAFWKDILKLTAGLIIPVGFGIALGIFVNLYNIWNLIAGIIAYSIIYAISVYFIVANKEEKALCETIFKKIIHRKK